MSVLIRKKESFTCRKKLLDRNSPKRAGIDNVLVFSSNELFVVDKPGPLIPHLKKQGEQFSTGPASCAEAVINIGNHLITLSF